MLAQSAGDSGLPYDDAEAAVQMAQVHATLALAAATLDAAVLSREGGVLAAAASEAWSALPVAVAGD